ncbi:MAG: hypothetical protein ACLRPV_14450 [Lacrimispora saccharolytica]
MSAGVGYVTARDLKKQDYSRVPAVGTGAS